MTELISNSFIPRENLEQPIKELILFKQGSFYYVAERDIITTTFYQDKRYIIKGRFKSQNRAIKKYNELTGDN